MKKKIIMKLSVICMLLALVLTVGFAVIEKKEAKADGLFDWFNRISVKKCAISLDEDTYNWTGRAIKPEVRVNYKGTDLEKNVDYVVSYVDNIDAGTGKVIIEGKGNYKGQNLIEFKIIGVDIERECIVNITNGVPEVYYNGQLLIKDKDYWYTSLRQYFLQESTPSGNGYLNEYKVVDYYTIGGKGKFGGTVDKRVETTTVKFEKTKGNK